MNRREAFIQIGIVSVELALSKPKLLSNQPDFEKIWRDIPPGLRQGDITHYAPGLMEEVINTRLRMNHLDRETIKMVPPGFWAATNYRNEVGSFIWLQIKDRSVGPILVVDCVSRNDLPKQMNLGRIGEVSYELAERLDIVDQPTFGLIKTITSPKSSRIYPF